MKKLLFVLLLVFSMTSCKSQDTIDRVHFDSATIQLVGGTKSVDIKADVYITVIVTDSTRVHVLNNETHREDIFTIEARYSSSKEDTLNYNSYWAHTPNGAEVMIASVYSDAKEFLSFGVVDDKKIIVFYRKRYSDQEGL